MLNLISSDMFPNWGSYSLHKMKNYQYLERKLSWVWLSILENWKVSMRHLHLHYRVSRLGHSLKIRLTTKGSRSWTILKRKTLKEWRNCITYKSNVLIQTSSNWSLWDCQRRSSRYNQRMKRYFTRRKMTVYLRRVKVLLTSRILLKMELKSRQIRSRLKEFLMSWKKIKGRLMIWMWCLM